MNIQPFLSQLCEHCGLQTDQATIDITEEDASVMVQLHVPEEDSGLFIGYHGETLDSLQRLVRIVFQADYADKKIILNVNDYRERREEKLREMVQSAAQKVLQGGGEFAFHSYLPSYERFFIHSLVSEDPEFSELESVSFGQGRERRLIIRVKGTVSQS